MPSRWKRVDLLSLASVVGTTAAARRQRLSAAPPASFPALGHLSSSEGRASDADGRAAHGKPQCNATPPLFSAQRAPKNFTTAASLTGVENTWVPAHAGLGGRGTEGGEPGHSRDGIQSPTRVSMVRLLCGSSLSWASAIQCLIALSQRHRDSHIDDHRCCCGTKEVEIPLEGILAVYARLLRHVRADVHCTEASASTDDAGPLPSLASDRLTSPLHFLALAAQHNASLQPIAALLPCGDNVRSAHEADNTADEVFEERAKRFCWYLSTVLHVGLRNVLRRSIAAPAAEADTEKARKAVQERWEAVRVVSHLQRYGWASDYLSALAAAQAASFMSAASVEQQQQQQLETAQPTENSSTPSAVVLIAAHLTPHFTSLFATLTEAWSQHRAHRLACIAVPRILPLWGHPPLIPGMLRGAAQREDGSAACVTDAVGTVSAEVEAVSMVRDLASPSAAHRERSTETGTTVGGVDDIVACNAPFPVTAMDLRRLTCDVVLFAWRAREVLQGRAVSAALPDLTGGLLPCARLTRDPLPPKIALPFERYHGDSLVTSASPPSAALLATAEAEEAEQDALLLLVQVSSTFMRFSSLCAWLTDLLPGGAPLQASCSVLAPAHGHPNRVSSSKTISGQQEQALLCLLTGAVRRAPSWTAACAILANTWDRLPRVTITGDGAGMAGSGTIQSRKDLGAASVPSLLEAFLTSPHAPKATLPLWSQTPTVPRVHPTLDVVFWCYVCAGTGWDGRHGANVEDKEEVARWSRLLYGVDEVAHCEASARHPPTMASMIARHDAATSALSLLVRCSLQPASAHDLKLLCLAYCHARCAEQWASYFSLSERMSGVDDRKKGSIGSSFPTVTRTALQRPSPDVVAAMATQRLADQHRAFSAMLMTSQEQLAWLDATLRNTTAGLARQFILRSFMRARHDVAPEVRKALSQLPRERPSAAEMMPATVPPCPTPVVPDIATILRRWVAGANIDGSIATVAILNASCALQPRPVSIGDVGQLLMDLQCAYPQPEFHPSLLDALFSAGRAAVTWEGLHLGGPSLCSVSPPSRLVGDAVRKAPIISFPSLEASVPAEDSHGPASATEGARASSEGDVVVSRRQRLNQWVDFLCTCPAAFLADEHSVVVWLYFLMRQVEEIDDEDGVSAPQQMNCIADTPVRDGVAATIAASACDPLHAGRPASNDDEAERPLPSVTTKEAMVRRVALSLSRRLWSELPVSSLVPPMLLNWLLVRGGARDWGEAVRALRAAAGAGDAEDSEGRECGRRFSFLGLPLTELGTIEHAVRVLRTLQVVEQRSASSAAACVGMGTPSSSVVRGDRLYGAAGGRYCEWLADEALFFPGRCDGTSSSLPPPPPLIDAERSVAATGGDGTGPSTLVCEVYRHIECVLLRTWYARALAAVLLFLLKHPHYTYLTCVTEHSDHATLALQRHYLHRARSFAGKLGEAEPAVRGDPASLRKVRDEDTVADMNAALATTGDVRRSDGCSTASAPTATAPSSPKETLQARVPMQIVETPANWVKGMSTDGDGAQDRGPQRSSESGGDSGAVEQTGEVFSLSATILPVLSLPSLDAHVTELRVPLHLLASFILQECRIGLAPCKSGDFRGGSKAKAGRTASPSRWRRHLAEAMVLTPLCGPSPSFAGASLTTSTFLEALQEEMPGMAPLPGLASVLSNRGCNRTPAVTSFLSRDERSPSPASACRPAHPELVELYLRVLAVKLQERLREEAETVTPRVAPRGGNENVSCRETIEEMMADLLRSTAYGG